MLPPGEDAWTLARKRGEVPPLSPVKPLKLKNHDHDHDHDHDLDICEGVSVQVVGDCMADPPLLVTQAREIEVIPANRGANKVRWLCGSSTTYKRTKAKKKG